MHTAWNTYKTNHGKVFSSSFHELKRKSIWLSNVNDINTHNAAADNGIHTFKLGINKFTDFTYEEFVSTHTGFSQSNCVQVGAKSRIITTTKKTTTTTTKKAITTTTKATTSVDTPGLPASVDWRTVTGYVGPIKDQGQCGFIRKFD